MKFLTTILLLLLYLTQCKDNHERAVRLNKEAVALINTNKKDSVKMALPLLNKAVSLCPDFSYGYTNIGMCYLKLGHRDSAIIAYERYANNVEDSKEKFYCYEAIGNNYLVLGKSDKADSCYRKSLKYAEQSMKDGNGDVYLSVEMVLVKKLLGQEGYASLWDYTKVKFARTLDYTAINMYNKAINDLDREAIVRNILKQDSLNLTR